MATDRKSVSIHYRKFNRPPIVGSTLEQLVRQALSTAATGGIPLKDRYLSRLFAVDNNSYFINTYSDGSGAIPLVFGDILHFTKGHLQALCKTADDNASSVPVQQMKAPEQSEYVHSQMFWMIKGDHAFVIQSMSLRTAEFEQYLEWLLKTKTSSLTAGIPIILEAKFDADAIGGDLEDIQEIIVGGVAAPPPTAAAYDAPFEAGEVVERVSEVTQQGNIDTGRRTGWTTATNILRELLGGDANVASLMNAVPADAELNVQVHIGYQTKKRKIDRVALRQLETGLRNLPDSQLQVKSKGARIASDGTIRLHHNASVKLIKTQDGESQLIGTLMDPTDVLRAMVEAYSNFIHNGKIQE